MSALTFMLFIIKEIVVWLKEGIGLFEEPTAARILVGLIKVLSLVLDDDFALL